MRFPDLKTLKPFGILCLLEIGAGAQAADLQGLVNRSPFASVQAAAETKTETPATLEFRGLVVDERGTTYSLFDTAAKRSYWVREGGKGSLRFKAFDAEQCVLEVEQNGTALSLPLKSATIATAAAPTAAATSPDRREGRAVVRVLSRPAAADGDRIAKIAEEVRRRRAARQAAAEGRTAARPSATPGF